MNLALYRHMMQLHLKMFFGFGVGSAIYVTLITSLVSVARRQHGTD